MKKIISLLIVITTLFALCTISVSAAREEEFLSEVALVYEDSVEDARAAIAGTDWKLWEQDLNPKADAVFDDGVYLIYKTSTNVEDAITDLRVMDMYGGYSTTSYKEQLENSREQYKQAITDLRKATAEFKALYEAGDEMAKLAYRQMNYYKDMKTEGGTETDMLMGDFFLDLPSDDNIVQVFMEGNTIIVLNLVSLLAVGISGADGTTLSERIAEMYKAKDTLTDIDYYDDAKALEASFLDIKVKLIRYDALNEEYNFDDEEMTEEEYSFITEYLTLAELLKGIEYGDTTLAEFIKGNWKTKDLYPIIAAFTDGQKALVEMGQLETVLKYNSPSASVEELKATLDEMEESMKDESGALEIYDVYLGVDREIFKGNFAFTNAAERQQAITGETWGIDDAASRSKGATIGYIVASALDVAVLGFAAGLQIRYHVMFNTARALGRSKAAVHAFASKWAPVSKVGYGASIAMALIILGAYGISTWYNYYNPDYTPIPNTLIDVRETDVGDKYIKYTAAKVCGDDDNKNADFNAYEGKEWVALYYTKDANAGSCLTPKFTCKDNDSTIARRHQGIAMFGETEAFNLNSHVYNEDAPGVYVTIRYSTAEKAAADMPNVVGSMVAKGALFVVTAVCGAGVGTCAVLLTKKIPKEEELA